MNPEIKVRTVKRYYVNGKGYASLYAACHATATREEKLKIMKIAVRLQEEATEEDWEKITDNRAWVDKACIELYGDNPYPNRTHDKYFWAVANRARELMQAYEAEAHKYAYAI